MASASQIKALVKSFVDNDESRFLTLALQMADREQKLGHDKVAADLRRLVHSKSTRKDSFRPQVTSTIVKNVGRIKEPQFDVDELLHLTRADTRLSSIVLNRDNFDHIKQTISEYKQSSKLEAFGLHPRRKLLLTGPPGTGKTLTAKVLACELKLPLYTLQFDGLMSRYMGETAAKLRVVFDHIASSRAVYLFDEFDAIGSNRENSNDVGEIRRVLNSFLQFFEDDTSQSLIVCATNHPELLDKALFRRFDDAILFKLPELQEAKRFIVNKLFMFDCSKLDIEKIAKSAKGLSFAELGQACEEAAKRSVLGFEAELSDKRLIESIRRRLN